MLERISAAVIHHHMEDMNAIEGLGTAYPQNFRPLKTAITRDGIQNLDVSAHLPRESPEVES